MSYFYRSVHDPAWRESWSTSGHRPTAELDGHAERISSTLAGSRLALQFPAFTRSQCHDVLQGRHDTDHFKRYSSLVPYQHLRFKLTA